MQPDLFAHLHTEECNFLIDLFKECLKSTSLYWVCICSSPHFRRQNPMDFSVEASAADEQQQPKKPIPKPRKSLLKNGNKNNILHTDEKGYPLTLKGDEIGATTLPLQCGLAVAASSSSSPGAHSSPPLPPRPSLSFSQRPLPPVPIHRSRTDHQQIDPSPIPDPGQISNNDWDNKSRPRLYPNLDDELLLGTTNAIGMPTTSAPPPRPPFPPGNLGMDWNSNNRTPLAPASSSSSSSATTSASSTSEFSTSSSSNSNDMMMMSLPTPTSSSAPYASFCEPFGADVQSDGESVCFSGWVQLPPGMLKHRKRGWAMVRGNRFSISPDDESHTPFYGPVDMSKCLYLGRTAASEIIFALRRDVSKSKQKSVVNLNDHSLSVLRFKPEDNMEYWLAFLAKCCSPRNDIFLGDTLAMVDCCGKLWIKQGISGHWNEGWAYVQRRILYYWVQGPNAVAEADIRKIFLVKQSDIPQSDWCNRIEHSSSGPLLISLEGRSLYLQADFDQCTKFWLELLNAELKKDVDTLEECRLTPEDIPVIVDKCIGLISTYGINQQGIYRKNGSTAEAKRIIQEFREDPYSVYLKAPISDEMINAVADVLRTFFRQLRAPLIPVYIHSDLYQISVLAADQKVTSYKALIGTLPKIHYRTLRKLLGHLEEIVSHENQNLASLDNIAKVFGPTLFNVSNNSAQPVSVEFYNTATKQAAVISDLVFNYCEIFDVSAEELETKCRMDVIREQKAAKNPATGLLIPIHLFERDNKCFNVQSEWTAAQVVAFKMQKLPFVAPSEGHALFEMIRDGQLQRRIGANETLRSIVLGRWLGWEEHQRNFLLLKRDTHPFEPQSGRAFAEDLKLAEPGSRHFKSASLRIEDGVHVCHYSKKTMKRQTRWKLDEMLWFEGAEAERRCPSHQYALTFFVAEEKRATGCTGKLPGYCVAFKDEIQRLQWLNQVIVSSQEYLSMPIIQI